MFDEDVERVPYEDQKRLDAHARARALYIVMTAQGDFNLTKKRLVRELSKLEHNSPGMLSFEQIQIEFANERAMKGETK